MGRWPESEFGVAAQPRRAYLFAELSVREKIEAVLGEFGKVTVHRHDVYERYIVDGAENDIDTDSTALELEFATLCHCASAAGIRAGGLLVISDTADQGLLDERPPRDPAMLAAFRAIKSHLEAQ